MTKPRQQPSQTGQDQQSTNVSNNRPSRQSGSLKARGGQKKEKAVTGFEMDKDIGMGSKEAVNSE